MERGARATRTYFKDKENQMAIVFFLFISWVIIFASHLLAIIDKDQDSHAVYSGVAAILLTITAATII